MEINWSNAWRGEILNKKRIPCRESILSETLITFILSDYMRVDSRNISRINIRGVAHMNQRIKPATERAQVKKKPRTYTTHIACIENHFTWSSFIFL